MSSLYIHCGLARTGTTSLQRFLADQREALEALGFNYPRIGLNSSGIAHHGIANELLLHPPRSKADMPATESLLDYLGSQDRAGNVVLSSEGFVNCLINMKVRDLFLDFLKSCMALNDRVYVVFTARILSQYFDSWYIQRLKIGSVGSDVESYIHSSRRWLRKFFRGIVLVRELLGADRVVVLDISQGERDSVAAFLSLANIASLAKVGKAERRNERLGLKKAGILYRLQIKQQVGKADPDSPIAQMRRAIVLASEFPDETYHYRVIPFTAANNMQELARKRVPPQLKGVLRSVLRQELDYYEAVSLPKVAVSADDVAWLRQALPAALGSSSLLDDIA